MKINKLHLKNWKSFDDNGIIIDDFKKMNIIIGPNNSGKSNLFRYLYQVREIINNLVGTNIDLMSSYGILNDMNKSFELEQTWAWKNSDIECKIEFGMNSELISSTDLYDGVIVGSIHHKQQEGKSSFAVVDKENNLLLESGKNNRPKVYHNSTYVDMREEYTQAFDNINIWKNFSDSMVFVDPIRHIERKSTGKEECDFNGCDLKSALIGISNSGPDWIKYKTQMSSWLEYILDEKKFEPRITPNQEIRFTQIKGTNEIEAKFNDLGTGVGQLFMILSYLYNNSDKSLNVFIEEPECNLHPEAVIRLMKILQSFENHTFFITTHSSTLIDQLQSDWTIHRVQKNDNQSSCINKCNSVVDKYGVLDELGIKASQILQSNYIIWVEGPSDRLYINKWIDIMSEGSLNEGIHYSFLMYGGSNLSSYSLLDNPDCIDILSTSRYATIVCDSDKKEDSSELKARVKNIIQRIEEVSVAPDSERKVGNYIKVWVTEGREIENYVKEELFCDVLFEQGIKKEYFQSDSGRIDVDYDSSVKADFGKFDSFDVVFSNRYSKANGGELSSEYKQKIATHYSGKKVDISREIQSKLELNNMDVYDLKDRLSDIITHIREANNICKHN